MFHVEHCFTWSQVRALLAARPAAVENGSNYANLFDVYARA